MTDSARIASLESQVRTLKQMLFGVFGLVVAGAVLGANSLQTVPDVIQAKKFEVLNDDGATLVSLREYKDHGAVRIFDKDRNPICLLFGIEVPNAQVAGAIGTYNSDNQPLVLVGADDFGHGSLITTNVMGKQFVKVGATKRGGSIQTLNAKGKPLVQVASTNFGTGALLVENGNGKRLAALAGTVNDSGTVITTNGSGKKLVEIGSYLGAGGGYVETFSTTGSSTSQSP